MKKVNKMFIKNKNRLKVLLIIVFLLIIQSCIIIVIDDENEPEEYISEYIDINGKVLCKETYKPIPGIHITIQGVNDPQRSHKDGSYGFTIRRQDVINIQFEDVDGPFNEGLFITKTESISFNKISYYSLNVYLDKAEPENTE